MSPTEVPPPNILLITTDQQRWETFGPFKPSFMQTPHLDNLAYDGVSFRYAYVNCPTCVASRTSIMTGQSAFTHRMGVNGKTSEYFGEARTLPTVLKSVGYHTALIGKAHFHPQYNRHGFDDFFVLDDYYKWIADKGFPGGGRLHGLGENELYATLATVPERLSITSWITETAADYLMRRRDPLKPWFLWVSYSKPHPPIDPPEPYYSMYQRSAIPPPIRSDWSEDPARVPHFIRRRQLAFNFEAIAPEVLARAKAGYYGMITQIDHNIGRLWAAIKDTGPHERFTIEDNTLTLFTSDHGELFGDHLDGAKGSCLDGSARVPFILRTPRTWKSRRHRGEICDVPVTPADILPTCAAAAGAEIPEGVEGINLLEMIERPPSERSVIFGANFTKDQPEQISWAALFDGQHKYAWHFADGRELLFDLSADPLEQQNLTGDAHAELCERLRGDLEARLRPLNEGRYLRDGKLWQHKKPPVIDEKAARGLSFPGNMRDDHPSCARH